MTHQSAWLWSAQQLRSRLGRADVVVFDCRFSLANTAAGRQQYMEGHIPGALYLDLDHDLSSRKGVHGGRHPLPDVRELAEKFGAAGVGQGVSVIVYDGGEGTATRAWWLLRYLGHDAAYVLDGGWPIWLQAHHEIATELPVPSPRSFDLQLRTEWVTSVGDVEAVVAGRRRAVLLDARAPERYRGDVEPLDPRAGHIPGAANAPWTDGVSPDGTWKSPAEQRARFGGLELERTDAPEVMVYCGSGVTACADLFALELAGVTGAKLYAGSWSDWCSYADHQVATGEENPQR